MALTALCANMTAPHAKNPMMIRINTLGFMIVSVVVCADESMLGAPKSRVKTFAQAQRKIFLRLLRFSLLRKGALGV